MKRTLLCIALSLFALSAVQAKDLTDIRLYLNSEDGIFPIGSTAIVEAMAKSGHEGQYRMYVLENGTKVLDRKFELGSDEKQVIYERKCDRNLGVIVFVKKVKENGKSSKESAGMGFVIAPEQFRPGYQTPVDFREFWDGELAKMRASKPVVSMKEVPVANEADAEKYVAYELEVSMHEGWPVRGYVAMPRNAAAKSLPVVLFFHGAGVNKTSCRSSVATAVKYAKLGGGSIAADINAHGMLNDQPQEYYDELNKGILKDYRIIEPKSKTDFYYRLMYLRDVRALDCLCNLPEWDGKHVLLYGQSQGGAQCAAVAALDARVGAAVLSVPGNSDEGAVLVRESGWTKHFRAKTDVPIVREVFPYYDTAIMLQFTNARLRIEVGLIDETCAPEGIFAAYNAASSKDKVIVPCPYRRHSMKKSNIGYKKWYKTIYADRKAFFGNYLAE